MLIPPGPTLPHMAGFAKPNSTESAPFPQAGTGWRDPFSKSPGDTPTRMSAMPSQDALAVEVIRAQEAHHDDGSPVEHHPAAEARDQIEPEDVRAQEEGDREGGRSETDGGGDQGAESPERAARAE